MTESHSQGLLYAAGFTSPKFAENLELPSEVDGIFTTPVMAKIATNTYPHAVETYEIIDPNTAPLVLPSSLALPLSIVWTGEAVQNQCNGADFSGNGTVNTADLRILAQYWLEINCILPDDCQGTNIDNTDEANTINLADLAILASYWLQTGCN